MTVIAKKEEGLLLGYVFSLFAGLMCVAIGFTRFKAVNIFVIIIGIFLGIISCISVVKYLRVPNEIISADNKGMLYFPKEVTLNTKDIIDVSYRCARGKSVTYDWGEVIIITHIESFKFDYVADCESVSKELTRMMYESKQSK